MRFTNTSIMANIGPQLPPGFNIKHNGSESDDDTSQQNTFGAELPPHLKKKQVAGPSLPPAYKKDSEDSDSDSETDSDSSDEDNYKKRKLESEDVGYHKKKKIDSGRIGPSLPPGFIPSVHSDSDSDGGIGPMPFSGNPENAEFAAARDFELRAKKMKEKLLNQDQPAVTERETWMMELPDVLTKNMGMNLEARSFSRSKSTAQQDSSWTETPADKAKREQAAREGKPMEGKKEKLVPNTRDLELSQKLEQYNKTNRQASLLELHQKKLHKKDKKKKDKKSKKEKKKDKKNSKDKKKDKKSKTAERRPFSREEDLNVNKFDDAMRKQLIKKSAELNTKFGHGATKFV